MDYPGIIAAIDEEVAKLKEARSMLVKSSKAVEMISRATRKGLGKKKPVKRILSPEARARIAEAQRRRWAAARRAAK